MHNKIAKFLFLLCSTMCVIVGSPAQAQECSAQICGSSQFCATPTDDISAFKLVDKRVVDKIQAVSDDVLDSISAMDTAVSEAINALSKVQTQLSQDTTVNLQKDMDATAEQRRQFKIQQKSLDDDLFKKPSANLLRETALKTFWPTTETLTRAIRQQLYEDHVRRVELEHENYSSAKSDPRIPASLRYSHGTIAGYAKLYATHKSFFCNAAGAQKPPGCGEDIKDFPDGATPGPNDKPGDWVKMGDQMLDIYLGDRTWPKEMVQQAIELMQYYLGMSPPDLPNTSEFGTGEGQRAYIDYQSKLAKNNFLTYILSYLVAKRAPTNNAQPSLVAIRQEAAGCSTLNSTNEKLCAYLGGLVDRTEGKASKAELSKSLEFDQFMNPAFIPSSIDGTLGVEKDITLYMVDRLQQDYEEYQMDKMITASMAGYYATLVNGSK